MTGLAGIAPAGLGATLCMTRSAQWRDGSVPRQTVRLDFIALVCYMGCGGAVTVLASDCGTLMARGGPFKNLGHVTSGAHPGLAETRGICRVLGGRGGGEEKDVKNQPH